MGNIPSLNSLCFGGIPTNGYRLYTKPEVTPHPLQVPTNDPCLGFKGRKMRETALTPVDYYSAKLPVQDRDYCADSLLVYRTCRRDHWPFPVFCSHEKHEYLHCKYEDYILRMKEYERERRLLVKGIIKKKVDD